MVTNVHRSNIWTVSYLTFKFHILSVIITQSKFDYDPDNDGGETDKEEDGEEEDDQKNYITVSHVFSAVLALCLCCYCSVKRQQCHIYLIRVARWGGGREDGAGQSPPNLSKQNNHLYTTKT